MPPLLGVKLQANSCYLWDALEFAACSGLRLPQCHGLEEGERDERRWRGGSSKKQMSNNSNNVKISKENELPRLPVSVLIKEWLGSRMA